MSVPATHSGQVDLTKTPWLYPGRIRKHSGVITADGFLRLVPRPGRRIGQARVPTSTGTALALNQVLLQYNAAAVDARSLVLAVGSNASPAILRRKLARHSLSRVVPLLRTRVFGIAVGHSAHVSIPGYIAAAPFASPGAETAAWALLLDDAQLACLDETEPNYRRELVDTSVHELHVWQEADDLDDEQPRVVEVPDSFWIYVSMRGLIPGADGEPLPFALDQASVQAAIRPLVRAALPTAAPDVQTGLREVTAQLAGCDVQAVARALHDHAAAVTTALATTAVRQSDTLGPSATDAGTSRYRTTRSTWPGLTDASGTLRAAPADDSLVRHGEQCVTLCPADAERVGNHAVVGLGRAPLVDDVDPRALSRVVSAQDVPLGTARVDQVVRNAIGAEIGDVISVQSASSRGSWRIVDWILGKPRYVMARVQAADLAVVERNACLLSVLALDLLGLQSGEQVVVEGLPGGTTRAPTSMLRAHGTPSYVTDTRSELAGGGRSSRFPSARDALAVHPDLPWVFLDSASRVKLGLGDTKLGVVRLRASRRHALYREVRELVAAIALGFIGIAATLAESRLVWWLGVGFFLLITGALVLRLRARIGD